MDWYLIQFKELTTEPEKSNYVSLTELSETKKGHYDEHMAHIPNTTN